MILLCITTTIIINNNNDISKIIIFEFFISIKWKTWGKNPTNARRQKDVLAAHPQSTTSQRCFVDLRSDVSEAHFTTLCHAGQTDLRSFELDVMHSALSSYHQHVWHQHRCHVQSHLNELEQVILTIHQGIGWFDICTNSWTSAPNVAVSEYTLYVYFLQHFSLNRSIKHCQNSLLVQAVVSKHADGHHKPYNPVIYTSVV